MVSFLSDTLHDNPFYLWHTHRSRNTWNVGWDWGGGGGGEGGQPQVWTRMDS